MPNIGPKLNLNTEKKSQRSNKKTTVMSPVANSKYNIDNLNKVENNQSKKLNAREWFQLGVKLQKENNQSKALLSYQKSVLLDPKCADAYNNLGVALRNLGHPEAAIASYYKSPRFKIR